MGEAVSDAFAVICSWHDRPPLLHPSETHKFAHCLAIYPDMGHALDVQEILDDEDTRCGSHLVYRLRPGVVCRRSL